LDTNITQITHYQYLYPYFNGAEINIHICQITDADSGVSTYLLPFISIIMLLEYVYLLCTYMGL